MKGLLLKDYYILSKQAKIFIGIILLFALLPGEAMAGFAVVYAAMLPITALAFDERAKWDTLAAMMPYTARDLVFSKYLLGYLAIAGAGILAYVAQIVLSTVKALPLGAESYLAILLIACIATIMLAFTLPLMFKFGVEKGRMAGLVFIAAVAIATVSLSETLLGSLSAPSISNSIGMIGLGALVLTVIINLVSVWLSTIFYQGREK